MDKQIQENQTSFLETKKIIEKLFKVVGEDNLEEIQKFLENFIKTQPLKQQSFKTQEISAEESMKFPELINEIKEGNGRTILHFSAARGNLDIFKYLIEKGGDCKIIDTEGNTPLFVAVQHNNLEIIQYIQENKLVDINQCRKSNIQVIHLAAANSEIKIIQYLLENGADLEFESNELGTPFEWAVAYGKIETVKFLIAKGANVKGGKRQYQLNNLKQSAEQNQIVPPPIIIAINQQYFEIVQIILDTNKDCINDKDHESWSCLQVCAEIGNIQILEELIKRGADVNYECKSKTALDLACENQRWECVSILRKYSSKTIDGKYEKVDIEKLQLEQQAKIQMEKLSLAEIQKQKEQAVEKKNEGNKFFQQNDFEQAIKFYNEAIFLDSQNAILFSNRAACNLKLENFKEALIDAQISKKLDNKFLKAHFREGEAYLALHEFGDAAASFWEGWMLEPSNKACQQGFQKAVAMGKEFHQKTQKKQ